MNLSEGILPRVFQLLTADTPTPTIAAAAAEPPRASMMESTVVSITDEYSHDVNKSRIHKKAIFTSREPKPSPAMSRSQRDIAYRLELSREAIGISAAELCKNVGIGTNQWSQYIDPAGKRRITVDAVYRLKDEYGITFEWIYDGDHSRLPGDLLEKIRITERLNIVDLSRTRGRRAAKLR